MSKRTDFRLFLGIDQHLAFTILTATGAVQDITGWSSSFMIKRGLEDADGAALVTHTDGIVSGTFHSDPDVNTQVLTVTLADTDTDTLPAGRMAWELKRTTADAESVLAYGLVTLVRGVHRA